MTGESRSSKASLESLKGINKSAKLKFNQPEVPTRDGYGDALLALGAENKNIFVLCADLSESTRVLRFKERFPERFIEVGVAEQNLVTVGSGLAAMGKIPFVSSYAIFCPGRCWEQIRTTIGYNNRNVKIIGAHAGISVGPDGATHQALEDIALMRCMPNMIVIVPADYQETIKATKAIAKHDGPSYMRFARDKTHQFTTKHSPFSIGKAIVLKEGKDLAIMGCGPVLYDCLAAALALQKKGIDAMVINCHTVKPLDRQAIISAAKNCGAVLTVEEAQIIGGLGSAVAELLGEAMPVPLKRIGVRDHYGESGQPAELLSKFGFSKEHIVSAAEGLIARIGRNVPVIVDKISREQRSRIKTLSKGKERNIKRQSAIKIKKHISPHNKKIQKHLRKR
ncbi:MAG TPA: transketolase family protein [Candidatus Nanoarchaeia archaeon]|nr:transketolase family protein [Candidatus Nanoarchaeia archaeon]